MSGPAWQALTGLPAWEITQIPRRDAPRPESASGDQGDHGAAQRMQALAAAYQRGAPTVFGWVRDRAGGRVRVIAAGPGLAAAVDGTGETVLTLPAGARAWPLPAGGAASLFTSLSCWTPVGIIADSLLADSGQEPGARRTGGMLPPSLEEALLGSWPLPFGWVVIADPVTDGQLRDLVSQVALAQLAAERHDSPRARLAARRAEGRHGELRRAAATGLWHIRLLAGGDSPDAAAQVAGLLCASADLDGLPYALIPAPVCGALTEILGGTGQPATLAEPGRNGHGLLQDVMAMQPAAGTDPYGRPASPPAGLPAAGGTRNLPDEEDPGPDFPCAGSTRLLAALARPPAREVPGIRFALRPDFDVTPETPVAAGGVALGTVLDRNRLPAGMLAVPLASLNRHVFVCGATGAGKSQTVRHLLESASRAGIPWLVVEPAKAEYRLMAARLPGTEVIVIRPGDLGQPAAGINPLEPAPGPDGTRFPLQTHADLLRALFLAAFQADEPFPQVLAAALTQCYEQGGWDLVTGQPAVPGVRPAYPSLEDLQAAAMTVVNEIGYGREVADNVRGFVTVRIGSLRLGTTGRFLDGGHPVDYAALLDKNVVLEIEDAGDDHDKAFLMGAVLVRLIEHLRLRHRGEGPGAARLRHLTVVEEAHRLLRHPAPGTASGPAAHATEMFADLLAEIRAYGEGLIIAEQIPAKLIPDVIKNTAVKIVHRLPAADDRAAVGATMNLRDAQSEYLVTLPPGEAAVHADGMDYPLLARMPDGTGRETGAAAPIVSPEPIVARRSLTCGPDCAASPCTLGQMRAAQRAAITDPRITMWAELTVVAHLTGWEMPRPSPVFTAGLRAMDARLRDCALSHAADAAIAARAPAISTRVSPAGLSAHVVAAMRQVISVGTPSCAGEEPQFLAPPYRWVLVRGALMTAAPGGGRHPRSEEWEHAYGESIPGATADRQLRVVNRRYARDQRDTRAVTTVIWGTRPRPAIEQAAGARVGHGDWPARLADALTAFARLPWPRKLLVRPGAPGLEAGKQAASE
jgi:uncharacterized protein